MFIKAWQRFALVVVWVLRSALSVRQPLPIHTSE
jgi:hypothetical protein